MPGRHVQLTILPYNEYSWPITYSLRKTVEYTKKLRSRSNKTWETDMYSIKCFHTPNIVDLLHTVIEKQTKTQKLNYYNHWTVNEVEMRWHLPVGHAHLTILHTPNIVDLLIIVSVIWTWPSKHNLVPWTMKRGRGQVKTARQPWGPYEVRTYQI